MSIDSQQRGTPLSTRVRVIAVDRRQRIHAGLALLLIVAALAVVASGNPAERSWMPTCPTWQYLGVLCPGCGSTRATHWLLQGELARAFHFNPALLILGVPLGILLVGSLTATALLGRRTIVTLPAWIGYGVAVLLVLYMVARNLPGPQSRWLRPPGPTAASAAAHAAGAAAIDRGGSCAHVLHVHPVPTVPHLHPVHHVRCGAR
jgi:hypothetical protein